MTDLTGYGVTPDHEEEEDDEEFEFDWDAIQEAEDAACGALAANPEMIDRMVAEGVLPPEAAELLGTAAYRRRAQAPSAGPGGAPIGRLPETEDKTQT